MASHFDTIIWFKLVISPCYANWSGRWWWWCITYVISTCVTLFPNTISSVRTMMKSFCWHKTPTIETCDLLTSFKSDDRKRTMTTIETFLSIFLCRIEKRIKSPQIIFTQKELTKSRKSSRRSTKRTAIFAWITLDIVSFLLPRFHSCPLSGA